MKSGFGKNIIVFFFILFCSLVETVAETHLNEPKVIGVEFYDWKFPGQPLVLLKFNQPVSKRSVDRKVFFVSSKRNYSVAVDEFVFYQSHPRYVRKSGNSKFEDLGNRPLEPGEAPIKYSGDVARDQWFVYPSSELPRGSEISMKAYPGIQSAVNHTYSTHVYTFHKFETFDENFKMLGVDCFRDDKAIFYTYLENLNADCDYDHEIKVTFTGPVSATFFSEQLSISAELPDFQGNKELWSIEDQWESGLRFAYETGMTFKVSLPKNLKPSLTYRFSATEDFRDLVERKADHLLRFSITTSKN